MINCRKGSAHSLGQTDFVGTAKASEAVIAGMLVSKNTSGEIVKVPKLDNATRASATNRIAPTGGNFGFALTTQSEGDSIASGKIGAYALDGSSVIETSYFNSAAAVTAADVGKPVIQSASTGADGEVTVVAVGTTERIIGWVFDAPRSIYNGQTPVTVLPIKLNA